MFVYKKQLIPDIPARQSPQYNQQLTFKMPAILKEVTTEAEMSATVDCLWDSYFDPYSIWMQMLFPIFEQTTKGYEAAMASSKTMLWTAHSADPSSHWVVVADSETGEVFSGAHWNFHKVSPFMNGAPRLDAVWHPEGEGRNFANHLLNQAYGPRGQRLWRPHAREFCLPRLSIYFHGHPSLYLSMLSKKSIDSLR